MGRAPLDDPPTRANGVRQTRMYMVFNVLVMANAVIVSFVLSTASRRRREARPLGRAVQTAGQLAYGTSSRSRCCARAGPA